MTTRNTSNLIYDSVKAVPYRGPSPDVTLTRNGTLGRVYGGDCSLIHIPDNSRADVGRQMAEHLDKVMREGAENRTAEQRASQALCPGCFMVAVFNMAVSLAEANGQPLSELGNSLGDAFKSLAKGGPSRIEHILVKLDPDN